MAASNTPSFTPSFTASFTPSQTVSFTPSNTPSRTVSNTPSRTPSASSTPSRTPSTSPAVTVTYYVDTASTAGGTGTTTATTGDDRAWATIAEVNAFAFDPGDSILFNRGCTWREQLTVPSSGSAGSPITFGAYGTGANPAFYGSKLASSAGDWTQDSLLVSGDLTNWSETDTASKLSATEDATRTLGGYGVQLTNNSTTTAAKLVKTVSNLATLHIEFYIKFADANTAWTDNAYIGMSGYTAAGNRLELYIKRYQSNMQLYSRFDNTGATDTLGYTVICADTDTAWHKIQIQAKFNSGGTGYHKVYFDDVEKRNATSLTTSANVFTSFSFVGDAMQNTGTPTTYFDDVTLTDGTDTVLTDDFESSSGDNTLWYTASTVNPDGAWRDGVMMTKVTNKVDIGTDVGDFWYDDPNDRVYVYGGASAPTTGGHTYEIGQRNNGVIGAASVDYITIDGLEIKYTNATAIDVGSNQNNWTVQNCIISYCLGNGIRFVNTSGHSAINNTISYVGYYNNADVSQVAGIFTASCTSPIISGNTITRTGRANIILYGKLQSGSIVEHNTLSYPGESLTHAYGVEVYGESDGSGAITNTTIRYNYIHDSPHANISFQQLIDGLAIHHNLLVDARGLAGDYWANITGTGNVGQKVENLTIYNNVLMQTGAIPHGRHNIRIPTIGWEGALIKNNIFYNAGTWANDLTYISNVTHTAPPTLDYNLHYSAQATFLQPENDDTTWALRPAGFETHGLNADPLFVSATDFHLQSASPARDAGVAVGLTTDYLGSTVPKNGAVDMGAYEYPSGIAVLTGS